MGHPYFCTFDTGYWSIFMNRNGTLLIESNNKSKIVIEKIEELLIEKDISQLDETKSINL
jgi:hypothetical protein